MKASEIDIRECWSVIEDVLRIQAPGLFATLAPPASEAEIAELEQIIGLRLPNDLTASLRCHNGQRDPSRLWSLTDGGMLLSTSGIAESWQIELRSVASQRRIQDSEGWAMRRGALVLPALRALVKSVRRGAIQRPPQMVVKCVARRGSTRRAEAR